jgi:nitroreductase
MSTAPNEPLKLILGRRSIRVFAPGEVEESAITQLLQAAMAAPSARAQDPWRFIVVRNRETRLAMANVLPYGRMLAGASLSIVVCGDLEAAYDQQLSYMLQDCSAAIENLLLCAQGLGLGTCWVGLHPREERMRDVRKVLSIPAEIIPVAAIAIGQAGEAKKPRTRFNPESVHQEKW